MSVAGRLLLSYVLVVAVGLLAAGVAISGLLVRYQDEITRVRLLELSAPLFTALQQGVRQGRPTRDVVQALTEQAQAAQIRVLVVGGGPQRRVVVDSEGALEGQSLAPPPADGSGVGAFRQGTDDWIFVQRAVGQAGVAVVARKKAVFADTLASLLPSLVVSALVAVGFALVVAALLSRTITRPLRDLVTGVRQLAAGRYRARATVGGPTEGRELGSAFNERAAASTPSSRTSRTSCARRSPRCTASRRRSSRARSRATA
jgi:HAMP domain-containing protein